MDTSAVITLSAAVIGGAYRVVSFAARGAAEDRLRDLGFVEGSVARPVSKAFLGAATAVEIRGSVFCVRKEQTDEILVEKI